MYYYYPLFIRVWHLLNAVLFIILVITGLNMQFSNPDHPFLSLSASVSMHKVCGIIMVINYFVFLTGNIISGNGKYYIIRLRDLWRNIWIQLWYYIRNSFSDKEPPFPVTGDRKFNPLQAFSYTTAMYIGVPLLFITGIGLLLPGIIPERVFGISGLLITDIVHVILGVLMTVFMLVHIYMVTLRKKPFSSYRAIITGWQQAEKE